MSPQRATITVEEAAEILGISKASAYRAAGAGEIPAIRIGRRLVIPRASFEKFLAGSETRTSQTGTMKTHTDPDED